MKGLNSVYLDVWRFLAAMGVLLWHAGSLAAAPGVLPVIYFNHKLVIIFFVISGYVIAASADRPDRTLVNYGADRLARLSSVVLPALLVTALLDAIGFRLAPELYAAVNPHWQWVRFVANAFYCQQIWFFCVNPSSNTPFWSLGYEFWYYVFLGMWVFIQAGWKRILGLLLLAVLVGPKILLLLPAWVVGAVAYHLGKHWQPGRRTSLALFLGTGMAMVLALLFEDQLGFNNGQAGAAPLYYSANYGGDNIFALMVAAHFFCCRLYSNHLGNQLETNRAAKLVKWLAGHTFSLYLYHVPILLFIRAAAKYDPHNRLSVVAAVFLACLMIVGLSRLTEEQYPVLRGAFRAWGARLSARIQPGSVPSRLPGQTQNA
jgi:peptidoglycan/LPS O-acetylase OafA/YrhL